MKERLKWCFLNDAFQLCVLSKSDTELAFLLSFCPIKQIGWISMLFMK